MTLCYDAVVYLCRGSGEPIELLPDALCIVGVVFIAQLVREEAGGEEQVLRAAGQSVSDFALSDRVPRLHLGAPCL